MICWIATHLPRIWQVSLDACGHLCYFMVKIPPRQPELVDILKFFIVGVHGGHLREVAIRHHP